MVKRCMKFLLFPLFLLVMLLITTGGKAIFLATRTVVDTVRPEARRETTIFVAASEEITLTLADDTDSILSFIFDEHLYPIRAGFHCNVVFSDEAAPIQSQIAMVTQSGGQSSASVLVPVDLLPPDRTTLLAIITLPPPDGAYTWFMLPATAVTSDSAVYVVLTEQGYFTERSVVTKVPVDIREAGEEAYVLVTGGINTIDLVVTDARMIVSDRQKVRLR